MASEEPEQINIIAKLSDQVVQEHEALQRKHSLTPMECQRIQEERDQAIRKLNEFQQVSHMVIEEVNAIQEELEIERTCRQSVEILASKLKVQNRSLKRKSMLLMAHLGPDTITEISLEEEEEEQEKEKLQKEEAEDWQGASQECLLTQCQSTIAELHGKLSQVTEEKAQAAVDVEALRHQLCDAREELLKAKHDNSVLIAETVRLKALLQKYNRVSLFAVEEFEVLQENLILEKDLRTEAEKFAREMLVEQKKLNRQSQLLVQSTAPGHVLQEALQEVAKLTQEVETQRLEHLQQMKEAEERVTSGQAEKELTALRLKLDLLEEEKEEQGVRCTRAETEVKDLRSTVEELQQRLQMATNPPTSHAPPPPPPPPPPLPPPPPPPSNPLSSLLSLIRKKKGVRADIPLVVQDSAAEPAVDVRRQAVDEMMERIKRGVLLRPVARSPATRTGPRVERLPSNSAIQELKGIMEKVQRAAPPRALPQAAPADGARELEQILLRRRGALEAAPLSDTPPPSRTLDARKPLSSSKKT